MSAALSSSWSNGQAEGQICKLKLVKRQMYGRGKLDLLQARVIGADVTSVIKSASEPLFHLPIHTKIGQLTVERDFLARRPGR